MSFYKLNEMLEDKEMKNILNYILLEVKKIEKEVINDNNIIEKIKKEILYQINHCILRLNDAILTFNDIREKEFLYEIYRIVVNSLKSLDHLSYHYPNNEAIKTYILKLHNLSNYFQNYISPIEASLDLIQDKKKNQSFTRNTVNYILKIFEKNLIQIDMWYDSRQSNYDKQISIEMRKIASYIREIENFSIKKLKTVRNIIWKFLKNNEEYIIKNAYSNRARIQEEITNIKNYLDKIKYL